MSDVPRDTRTGPQVPVPAQTGAEPPATAGERALVTSRRGFFAATGATGVAAVRAACGGDGADRGGQDRGGQGQPAPSRHHRPGGGRRRYVAVEHRVVVTQPTEVRSGLQRGLHPSGLPGADGPAGCDHLPVPRQPVLRRGRLGGGRRPGADPAPGALPGCRSRSPAIRSSARGDRRRPSRSGDRRRASGEAGIGPPVAPGWRVSGADYPRAVADRPPTDRRGHRPGRPGNVPIPRRNRSGDLRR